MARSNGVAHALWQRRYNGAIDVIGKAPVGVLDNDLRHAALRALSIPRNLCRDFALRFSWRRSAEEFVGNLMWIRPAARRAYS